MGNEKDLENTKKIIWKKLCKRPWPKSSEEAFAKSEAVTGQHNVCSRCTISYYLFIFTESTPLGRFSHKVAMSSSGGGSGGGINML